MPNPTLDVPRSFADWLSPFLEAFASCTRRTVVALAVGAVLAAGPRTVANCLRALGRADDPGFATFHRVLNRNAWCALIPARALLRALVAAFVPEGPVVVGLDHTLERRRGDHVHGAGPFHDAVRSSKEREVSSNGLRWLTAMLVVRIPFAGRVWGLPVLTALAPSRRWSEAHGRRPRPVTERARAMLLTLRRWLPGRRMVAVMDGEFAALDLLHALAPHMAVVSRLRLDARLFDPPDPLPRTARHETKGERQPKLRDRLGDRATVWRRVVGPSRTDWRSGGWIEYAAGTALWHHPGRPIVPVLWILVRYPDGRREPEAFLCTDLTASPREALAWYDRRWAVETTYQEARAHLGVETQRQWSEKAVSRATPMLLALYSLLALYAHEHADRLDLRPHRPAWYPKPAPTFADVVTRVRRHLWLGSLVTSPGSIDMTRSLSPTMRRLVEAACAAP